MRARNEVRVWATVSRFNFRAGRPFRARVTFGAAGIVFRAGPGGESFTMPWPTVRSSRLLVESESRPDYLTFPFRLLVSLVSVGRLGGMAGPGDSGGISGPRYHEFRVPTIELTATDGITYVKVLHKRASEVVHLLGPFLPGL